MKLAIVTISQEFELQVEDDFADRDAIALAAEGFYPPTYTNRTVEWRDL